MIERLNGNERPRKHERKPPTSVAGTLEWVYNTVAHDLAQAPGPCQGDINALSHSFYRSHICTILWPSCLLKKRRRRQHSTYRGLLEPEGERGRPSRANLSPSVANTILGTRSMGSFSKFSLSRRCRNGLCEIPPVTNMTFIGKF
jgi:hypothetical protein